MRPLMDAPCAHTKPGAESNRATMRDGTLPFISLLLTQSRVLIWTTGVGTILRPLSWLAPKPADTHAVGQHCLPVVRPHARLTPMRSGGKVHELTCPLSGRSRLGR